MSSVLQYVLYLVILVALAVPLGAYIKKVMDGKKTVLSKILTPCENAVYKVMRVDKDEQMNWKKYLLSILIFSGIGLLFLFLPQLLQGVLPGNPQGLPGVKWDLYFNTAVSFVTNTNWQAYTGESTLSYLTQALGLTVQNFAATGIAVLFALIRGFIKVKTDGLGSFWVDMTRIVVHILIPLNLVIALCLVGGGVIQNVKPAETVSLLEPIAISADGQILENAVILWFTVLFANFAEAIAEGRGKAQADSLRAAKKDVDAYKIPTADEKDRVTVVPSASLKKGDLVLVKAGEQIPADGEVVGGAASVDESAITGESAPVIRESSGDLITTTLETHNYRYQAAPNGESAIMEAVSHNPDVILLDLGLPDMDGIDIIRKIRSWSTPHHRHQRPQRGHR